MDRTRSLLLLVLVASQATYNLAAPNSRLVRALDVSPLDVHHALDTVNGLVGILGGGVSSLVVELTGISLTDCALSFNGVDVPSLSCEDFLDILSTCDSLTHVKPVFRAAKKKLHQKHVPTNRPCSRNMKH